MDTLQVDDTVEVKGNNPDTETGRKRDGCILEKIYDTHIGITSNDKPCSKLKVVLGDDGFVVTAYPVK